MEGFGGRYPGGPSRGGHGDGEGGRRRAPDLRPTEELEARAQEQSVRRRQRKRRKRIVVGFLVALLVAGGVGAWVGIQAHRTSEEMTRERDQRAPGTGEEEQDRMLRELLRQPQSEGSQPQPQMLQPGEGGGQMFQREEEGGSR